MEYKIMEYIMKNVIFEKRSLRESFMQEVLNSSGISNYRTNLESYLNANAITVKNYMILKNNAIEEKGVDLQKIRIIELTDCEINISVVEIVGKSEEATKDYIKDHFKNKDFVRRLFVITS